MTFSGHDDDQVAGKNVKLSEAEYSDLRRRLNRMYFHSYLSKFLNARGLMAGQKDRLPKYQQRLVGLGFFKPTASGHLPLGSPKIQVPHYNPDDEKSSPPPGAARRA